MKNIFVIVLICLSSLSFGQYLKQAQVPLALSNAVKVNYELGRHQADFGGISQVDLYRVEANASVTQIVYEIVQKNYWVTENLFEEFGSYRNITYLTLRRDERVMASWQPKTIFEFIHDLELDDHGGQFEKIFNGSLSVIKQGILGLMGKQAYQFSLGFDYIADVYLYILISTDRKRVMVVTADYGA